MSRSPLESDLLERAAAVLPAGVRSAGYSPEYAMVIAEARGSRIRDASGREYIDYLLGSGPMLLGHAHPDVARAVCEALERGTGYLLLSEPAIRLAEKIVALVPCAERVTLHTSGSEATFFALRLARAFRRRDKVLKFEGGFHGMGDVALMSNQWLPAPLDPPRPVPVSAGIPASAARDVIVARFNDTAGTVELIERFQDELAAVIVEPMQRTLQPVPGFLQAVREATARLGIPLVFDEVVTGFRLALGGAQEYYGVIPDLCAMGKSISAGLPLGLVCGRADIMSLAEPARRETGAWVALTGTYSGNPVVASAALAAIEVLERPGTYERLFATGRRLMDGLRRALAAAGLAAHVTGEPPAFEAWFTDEEVTDFRAVARSDHRLGRRFAERLIDRGILKAHEKFFVSLAHDADDVDRTIRAFEAAALELAASPPSIDENLV